MHRTALVSLLLASFAAFAQVPNVVLTVEEPTALDASNQGTWRVRVTNPGTTPTGNVFLVFNHSAAYPFGAQFVSIPQNCTHEYAVGCNVEVAPGATVELKFVLQYSGPYGAASVDVTAGAAHVRERTAFVREYLVTTTADSGAGSLRNAMLDMNRDCTNGEPCGAVFRIDGAVPEEGWFTIRPLSALPEVTAEFSVFDGRTQSRYSGDTNGAGPEIMIDGASAGRANGLHFGGGTAQVGYLAIGNFNGNGIEGNGRGLDVYHAYIGLHPSGTRAASNVWRGIQANRGAVTIADSYLSANGRAGAYISSATSNVTRNVVGLGADGVTPLGNGASGLFFQKSGGTYYDRHDASENVIANNGHAGIGFNPNVIGDFGANTFFNNGGLPIDAGMDGPTPNGRGVYPGHGGIVPSPSVVSARYEAGRTIIEGTLPPPAAAYVHTVSNVYVYASRNATDGGELIATVPVDFSSFPGGRFTVSVERDLRGYFVSAATHLYLIYSWDDPAPGTSELSASRLVQ